MGEEDRYMRPIVFAVALSIVGGGAVYAGPSMTTKWNTTTMNLERCKSRGEDALRDARFRGVKVLQYSVFGERGDYSAMIRCATDKGVVFFVVAGPEVERANRYIDEVSD
jgi:hypothetical protein